MLAASRRSSSINSTLMALSIGGATKEILNSRPRRGGEQHGNPAAEPWFRRPRPPKRDPEGHHPSGFSLAAALPLARKRGGTGAGSAEQDEQVNAKGDDDDRGQDEVALAVQIEQMADSAAEHGAQAQEEARPDRGRDRDAGHEDRIVHAEDPGRDRERDSKSGDVGAEHEGPDAPAREPAFRLVDPGGRQAQQARESMFDDRAAPTTGDEIEVGGAQDDDRDQSEPGREQRQQAVGTVMADVHDEDVARHWHRDPGLLEVEEGEGRRLAEAAQEKTNELRAVTEGLGEVAFEDGERRQHEDRGEQEADRPPATPRRNGGHRPARRAGAVTPAHRHPLCESRLNGR